MAGRLQRLAAQLLLGVAEYRSRTPTARSQLVDSTSTSLQADVEIRIDEWGVPHIYASTSYDVYFAQGFVHAQDRLWQMASMRALCEGKLSSLIGSSAVKADTFTRTLNWIQLAEEELEMMKRDCTSQALVATLIAYCDGVNHFLAKCASSSNSSTLPAEFFMLSFGLAPTPPEPWTPLHLVLVGKLMALQMSAGW